MNTSANFYPATALLAAILLPISGNSFAMMELPFCPAGGPPGWFNYFSDRHDRNRWQHHNYYPMSAPPANYNQGYYYPPEYNYPPNRTPPEIRRTDVYPYGYNNTFPHQPARYNRD